MVTGALCLMFSFCSDSVLQDKPDLILLDADLSDRRAIALCQFKALAQDPEYPCDFSVSNE